MRFGFLFHFLFLFLFSHQALAFSVAEFQEKFDQLKLSFGTKTITVRNATYQASQLFPMDGQERLGVILKATIDDQVHYQVAYQSLSQGTFRILPALSFHSGKKFYEKGMSENSLTLPSPVQALLSNKIDQARLDITSQEGFELVSLVVPSLQTEADRIAYENQLETQFTTKTIVTEAQLHLPGDLLLVQVKDHPNFKESSEYSTFLTLGGQCRAFVYPSQDSSVEYLVFQAQDQRIWVAAVVSLDSKINLFGVPSIAINAGALTSPLWEYKRQTHPAFRGETNGSFPAYVWNWRFLKRLQVIADWYKNQNMALPSSQSLSQTSEEELPPTQEQEFI